MKWILLACLAGACAQTVKLAPVKVEPIHMTIDVNLKDSTTPKR